MNKKEFNEDRMKMLLAALGDSLVLVQDEDLVKVHIHTLTPGTVLNLVQEHGEFVTLKIDNMQEQHNEIIHNDYTLIAEGSRITQELSDFLKATGRDPSRYH